MQEIRRTTRFKRDYRRELSGVHGSKLDELMQIVLEMLTEDLPFAEAVQRSRTGGNGVIVAIVTSALISC